MSDPQPLDLIWGAAEIAKVIGRTERATYGMLESGELPAKKVSGKWVIPREALRLWFSDRVAA